MKIGDLLGQLLPVLVIGALALLGAALLAKKGTKGAKEAPNAKRPLTEREQAMFFRLQQAFPDHVVMPQVAFSALLSATTVQSRNTFDRKVADFVLCTKAFEVVCAIELDDASHRSKGAKDAARDKMLSAAGYTVARFKNVPDVEPLRSAISGLKKPSIPTK
jgi:very-short-patch-repair endonuclease